MSTSVPSLGLVPCYNERGNERKRKCGKEEVLVIYLALSIPKSSVAPIIGSDIGKGPICQKNIGIGIGYK